MFASLLGQSSFLPDGVELLANPFARQLTLALAHFVWQGFTVALLLVLVVKILRIHRPQARYACSLTALAAMILLPLATLLYLGANEPKARASGFIPEANGIRTGGGLNHGAAASVSDSNSRQILSASTLWQVSQPIDAAQPYLLAAWLLGVAILSGRLAFGAVGILRLRQKLIPLPLDLASSVERLGRRLQVEAMPLVFLSRRVTGAMAVGVVRPLVLIPASWATEMPLEMLEAVIAHELAHLRRRDLLVNLLQRVVETILFYHPAVWWLSSRLRQERELCADELAVAATGRRLEYAQTLEQVARRQQADVGPALAAFIRGGKNMRLLERVQNVLGLTGNDRARLWPAGLLILALPLVLWVASLGLPAAVADDERKEGDRPVAEREADGGEKEVRREKEEGDAEREGKKFFAKEEREDDGERKEKEVRKDGDAPKKEGPRDGDAPRKEGPRDGDVKKEGPRDGGFKKEGTRDGDRPVKEGARDGDRPVKEGARDGDIKKERPREGDRGIKKEGARDGDAPRKEVRKDEPRKEGDKVRRDGSADEAIYELKALVSKLMAENKALRAELDAARGGKDYMRKEGDLKRDLTEGQRKEALLKERAAAERKESASRKEGDRKEGSEEAELRERKERAAAEEKEAAGRKEREGDERALIEKKRAAVERAAKEDAAEKEEAAARERLRKEIDKTEVEKEVEKEVKKEVE